jgi:hypothetical protein
MTSSHNKDDFPDNFSESTYRNENTPYNHELRNLRTHLPGTQPTRHRAMEDSYYDSRYAGINNAAPSGSDRLKNRAKRIYDTACCGSCLTLLCCIGFGIFFVVAAIVGLVVLVVVSH